LILKESCEGYVRKDNFEKEASTLFECNNNLIIIKQLYYTSEAEKIPSFYTSKK